MDDLIRQVTTMLKAAWHQRWLGLGVAFLAAIVAAAVVLRVPDKYEASARIYVDTESMLKPLMSGLTVQPNVEQRVMMLSRTLISRPNVEKLIRMADLDLANKSKQAQEELIDHLTKNLQIKSTSRDNLYSLAYRDPDPNKAKRVIQSLTSIFVESSLGDKRKDSDSAKKFIDEQIKVYEKKLEEAETRLKEFKVRNIELQTADGKGAVGRLSDVGNQLNEARLALREAENSKEALRRHVLGEGGKGGSIDAVAMPELDGRIEAKKKELDTLLQRFTEQHPDVIGARRIIRELQEQKRREVAELRKAAAANPGVLAGSSAASAELKNEMASAEAKVASLRTRVSEYESRYNRIQATLKDMPQLEAEYAQLNRDYDIHKRNYEALVSRRESANLTGDLDAASGVVDFRLIDPPRVSSKPVAPNRVLLLPLALLAALGVGVLTSLLASQVRPVFFDLQSLREATGQPILGSVSLIKSEALQAKERSDLRRFFAGLAVLIGLFVVGIVVLYFTTGAG